MKYTVLIPILFFLLTSSPLVQAQSHDCSLTTYFVDKEAKASSSRYQIAEFPFAIGGKSAAKLFAHQESNVDVSVGVEYVKGIFENEPKGIRLAIAFAGKPEDIFHEVGRAEAESVYDKHWRWLSLSKSTEVANRIYTFTFGCERRFQMRRR